MKRKSIHIVLLAFCIFSMLLFSAEAQATRLVNSSIIQGLVRLFPELSNGYMDLNDNGKEDQNADLNELIPESRIKDDQLQAQEILDFIVSNWQFITLEKLREVKNIVTSASGAINELIAIDFSSSLDEAIRLRDEMGDSLYLTASAYKEAMAKIGGIISTMTAAYKKEGTQGEGDFVKARDELFTMIDKGYPLPEDLPQDEGATLSTSMLGTVIKEQKVNPAKAKTAIRTLGRLGSNQAGFSPEAAPYLLGLAEGSDFQIDAIKALGSIGYKPAIPFLSEQILNSPSADIRKASLHALGDIGGADGLEAILGLLKDASNESFPQDLLFSITQALTGIAKKGNADSKVQNALKDLTGSQDPQVRKAAVEGLGFFTSTAAVDALMSVLNSDKDGAVRTQAVIALGRQKSDAVSGALIKVLREKDPDRGLKIAAIEAVGDLKSGSQAISLLVDTLADTDEGLRTTARASLIKLYPANQNAVTGALTRSLQTSENESFLVEGTGLLAVLADPGSVNALLTLLQRPIPAVKRNVAWAFYKIGAVTNTRVVDELQKIITNESEPISVRVNAVRAVGAIGYDSPQINLWQSLVTTAGMRGDRYVTLRYYAVWALGQVGDGKPEAIEALTRIAARDADAELRKQALVALRDMAEPNDETIEALSNSYVKEEEGELKTLILETLADMGSSIGTDLAVDLLNGTASLALKRRALSVIAQSPDEKSASALIDASRDPELQALAEALLEGYPASFMASLVSRRLRTETDAEALSVLEALEGRFAE